MRRYADLALNVLIIAGVAISLVFVFYFLIELLTVTDVSVDAVL